jgi:Spy/CpxP family protein refolding chaperone
MKTFLFTSLFATSLMLAQGPGTPPDPATMVQHKVARLTTLLTLTTAQQTQATTIFTAAATADATFRTDMATARTSLTTAIKNNDASGITLAANTIGTLTTQQTATDAKASAAFYQILTVDQRTKLDAIQGEGRGGGFGMRRGPGGPGGGGPF